MECLTEVVIAIAFTKFRGGVCSGESGNFSAELGEKLIDAVETAQ